MSPFGIAAAFLMDIAVGDPKWAPHPVRIIGKFTALLERGLLCTSQRPAYKVAAGAVLAVTVVSSVFLAGYGLLHLARHYTGETGGWFVSVYLAYTTISVKGLADAARDVSRPLEDGRLDEARKALSMVVGRDTVGLSETEAARGAVETVAENTSDGIVAPLFYLALGGVPLALAYKAINTMDSMVGYKNERYRHFGYAAARLDDLANFVPARLTALLMAASAWLLSLRGGAYSHRRAWRILVRDHGNHPSSNSGYPESAAAGALGVRLGGESSYGSVVSVKPYIGEPDTPLSPDKIADAVRLMYVTAFLMLGVAVILCFAENIFL